MLSTRTLSLARVVMLTTLSVRSLLSLLMPPTRLDAFVTSRKLMVPLRTTVLRVHDILVYLGRVIMVAVPFR
ncbi:unnamed protein product, partial [Vitis vinifera]|uniref:Uncharacterized protein n=1 Tax=Vitis vinifera TaxID=29760 RepID=D7T2C5_VITVI